MIAVRGDVPLRQLVGQVIEKRRAPDWDRANHLMATEIEPALASSADQLAAQVTHTRDVDKMAKRDDRGPARPFIAPAAGDHQRHPARHPGGPSCSAGV